MIKQRLALLLIPGLLLSCRPSSSAILPPQQSDIFKQLNTSSALPEIQHLTVEEIRKLEQALSQAHRLQNTTELRTQITLSDTGRKVIEAVLPYLKTSYGYMRRPRTLNTQASPKGAQAFTLKSIDGTLLKGFYLATAAPEGQNKTIILQHGYQFNKWMAYKRYGFLNKNYNILAIDARAHNQQSGESSLGVLEKEDIKAALHWLEQRSPAPQLHKVGLLGESMGAATVIAAAADWSQLSHRSVQIKGVWSDAAYADLQHAIEERTFKKLAKDLNSTPEILKKWGAGLITRTYLNWLAQDTGVNNVEHSAAPRYNLPILLKASIQYAQVHSKEDEQTHFDNAVILADIATQVIGQPFTFWQASGKHVETYQSPEYAPRVEAFFKRVF